MSLYGYDVEVTDARNRKFQFSLDRHPDSCPICGVPGEQIYEETVLMSKADIKVVMRCPVQECDSVYLAVYHPTEFPNASNRTSGKAQFTSREPVKPKPYSAPQNIKTLSSAFVQIANQAKAAEEYNLVEIAGPGYRKALEFLIKDYLIKIKFADDGEKRTIVGKTLLGPCIEMLEDGNIKRVAARAAWLGNDETHYERRWTNKDLGDLKTLLNLTVRFIESDLDTRTYLKEMPDAKARKRPGGT